jgi:hypothetical protein
MSEPGFVDRSVRDVIPDLDSIPPGPYLAAILSSIDRTRLNGYDLVVVLRAHDRMASHYQAERLADMVEVAHCVEGSADSPLARIEERQDFASDEIRAALSLTRRSAETQLGLAVELAERLPGVLEAFRAGRLSLAKVWVIVKATSHLPVETAAEVAGRALEEAEGKTTGQLGAWLGRLCIQADPEEAKKRYEESLAHRRVAAEANVEGTANIHGMELEPHRVSAVMRRINHMAKSLKTADEIRTMDQLRADVFIDLLLGKAAVDSNHKAPRGVVDLTVDLPTLLDLSERPGEVGGYGPVIADIARKVSEEQTESEWRWTVTDGDGAVLANGTTRRRPDPAQRRYIEARSQTCVFPGCRTPATECEIDHNHPWALGGPTHPVNEGPLCRHDNVGKEHGWRLRRLRPGVYCWTSPLGHTYITESRRPP